MDHSLLSAILLISKVALAFILSTILISAESQDVFVVMLKQPPVSQVFSDITSYENDLFPRSAPRDPPNARATRETSSAAADAYALQLTRSHDYLLEHTLGQGSYKKVYSYNYLINGFSVLLTESQVNVLSALPQVLLVEKDKSFQKLTTYTPTYIGLVDGAWKVNGGQEHAGEGIVIGVVDTGIDPTHPSFKDNNYSSPSQYKGICQVGTHFPKGSCNNKLVGAQYFAEGAIASGLFNASIHYASPIDAEGHGTHTSSTAAGNSDVEVIVDGMSFGFASGMAPKAHVAMYRALYPGFGGLLSDVVAAIEQALKDKVDILSLSIGPGAPPAGASVYINIFDLAMLSAVKAGVFVAQAAGNSGPYPLSMASFGPWICSVASSMHDRTYTNSLTLGNNKTIKGQGLAPPTSGKSMYSLVTAKDALKNTESKSTSSDATECQDASSFDQGLVQGKLLICTYTINFFLRDATTDNVVATAQNLSAAGVVMTLASDLLNLSSYLPAIPFSVPAILVTNGDEVEALMEYYATTSKSSTATAKLNGGATAKYSKESPKVAAYSSRGPAPANNKKKIADILKPNVMAPGTMIWAAWSHLGDESAEFQGKNFAIISGTSMATPHIAGIAALLKQKNPNLSPAAISSALATTAYNVDQSGKPLLAQHPSYDINVELGSGTPFDFGAGEVNATAALDPGLVFDAGFKDYVKFLCSIPGSDSAVKNATGTACTSNSGLPTDLNLPSITIANLTEARVFPRQVTNVAGATETYTVRVETPTEALVKVQPTTFTIAPLAKQSLNVTLVPSTKSGTAKFGYIKLVGSHGHVVSVTVSIGAIYPPPSSSEE